MPHDPYATSSFSIRRLTQVDAGAYRALRLEALQLHPEAFSADFATESQMGMEALAARMRSPPSGRFGGFVCNDEGEVLAGIAGLVMQQGAKVRHKGQLVGMYVAAPHRRIGLAAALLQHVINQARTAGLQVLQLGVTVGNEPARQLYTQFGFRSYGVEQGALCVNGRFYDEELMALWLA